MASSRYTAASPDLSLSTMVHLKSSFTTEPEEGAISQAETVAGDEPLELGFGPDEPLSEVEPLELGSGPDESLSEVEPELGSGSADKLLSEVKIESESDSADESLSGKELLPMGDFGSLTSDHIPAARGYTPEVSRYLDCYLNVGVPVPDVISFMKKEYIVDNPFTAKAHMELIIKAYVEQEFQNRQEIKKLKLNVEKLISEVESLEISHSQAIEKLQGEIKDLFLDNTYRQGLILSLLGISGRLAELRPLGGTTEHQEQSQKIKGEGSTSPATTAPTTPIIGRERPYSLENLAHKRVKKSGFEIPSKQ